MPLLLSFSAQINKHKHLVSVDDLLGNTVLLATDK